ncbi:hypothetical protein [Tessaracoccus lacteus]|uniref:Uncharacterized protein n=1 Tax=Tessaracoccus lacteus TaxID=3041766 RepID=A0ABY8PZM9_9ACTN|nr:hypothetical protein [Tessaracoccus sp. T21]WGT47994.1 hypothetical protein QH948_04300 [Tessaracoccus sp. T21]
MTTQLEQGRLTVKTPAIDRQLRALQRTATRVVSAVIFAGLLIGGAVLHATEPTMGVWLMGGSALPLLHALLAGRRPRRHGARLRGRRSPPSAGASPPAAGSRRL